MSSSSDSNSLEPSREFPPPTIERQQATASVNALQGVMTNIGDSRVTERAQKIRVTTDEEMVWQAKPSLLLLLPRAIKYGIIMTLIVFACSYIEGLERKVTEGAPSGRDSAGSRVPQIAPARKPGHSLRSKTGSPVPNGSGVSPAREGLPDPVIAMIDSGQIDRYLQWVQYGVGAILLIRLGLYLLSLATTTYQASSQRLTIESGIRRTCNVPFELHELGDAVIVKPLILRPFGVAHLHVTRRILPAAFAYVSAGQRPMPTQTVVTRSGIATQPYIDLYGLRNAHLVRDLLRQGGQIEAQRPDKIRFR